MADENTNYTYLRGKKITAHDNYYSSSNPRNDNYAYLVVGYNDSSTRDNYKLSLNELYDNFEEKIKDMINDYLITQSQEYTITCSNNPGIIIRTKDNTNPTNIKGYEELKLIIKPDWGYSLSENIVNLLPNNISGCSVKDIVYNTNSIEFTLYKPEDNIVIENLLGTPIGYAFDVIYTYEQYNEATDSYELVKNVDFALTKKEFTIFREGGNDKSIITLSNIISSINSQDINANLSIDNVKYTISTWSSDSTSDDTSDKKLLKVDVKSIAGSNDKTLEISLLSGIKTANINNLKLYVTIRSVKEYLLGFIYQSVLTRSLNEDISWQLYNDTTDEHSVGDPIQWDPDNRDSIACQNARLFYNQYANRQIITDSLKFISESDFTDAKLGKQNSSTIFKLYIPNNIENQADKNLINMGIPNKNYVWLICPKSKMTLSLVGDDYNHSLKYTNGSTAQFTAGFDAPLSMPASSIPSPDKTYKIGNVEYYMIPLLIETYTEVFIIKSNS